VVFQALLERQMPGTTAILHRADTEVRVSLTSVPAFTDQPTDTARRRPVSRLSGLSFHFPHFGDLRHLSSSEEEVKQRPRIINIEWPMTCWARGGVVMHVLPSPDWRAERENG